MEESKNENIETKVFAIEDLDIKQGAFICNISKRASGKTNLTRNLVKHLLDLYEYDLILIFSETSHFNKDYDFIPQHQMFKTSDIEGKVEKILKLQYKNIKKNKKIHLLIILDDVHLTAKSKQLCNLGSLGRHYLITTICNFQYSKGICSSSIRNNIDYFFISQLGEPALRSVYDNICINMSYKNFEKFVDENNHSYQFLFYDARTQDRKQRLKIVKAKEFSKLILI